jgi:hypothetical protein
MPRTNRDFAFGVQLGYASPPLGRWYRRFLVRQRGTMFAWRFEIFSVRRALATALFRTLELPQNAILARQQVV